MVLRRGWFVVAVHPDAGAWGQCHSGTTHRCHTALRSPTAVGANCRAASSAASGHASVPMDLAVRARRNSVRLAAGYALAGAAYQKKSPPMAMQRTEMHWHRTAQAILVVQTLLALPLTGGKARSLPPPGS